MRTAWLAWGGLLAVGCAIDPIDAVDVDRSASSVAPPVCGEIVLPWGSGDGAIGRIAAGEERSARGPSAIAVAPGGELLILDSVNHRVVAVGTGGAAATLIAEVDPSALAIAVGDDGAVAVFSPARATAWVYARTGEPAGLLTLPRGLRHLVGVSFGRSRQLRFANGYQETFTAGSPALPLDLGSILRSKLEGACALDDDRGVLVEVAEGHAEVVVVDNRERVAGKPRRGPRYPIPGPASAAQIVGATQDLVCLRVETVAPDTTVVAVARRVVCLDLASGDLLHSAALPDPGPYRPRHELTLGGAPPRLAWMHPRADGLAVATCEVSR